MSTESKGAPISVKFLFSATSGIGATLFSYPFELVKNRMQMSGEAGKKKEHSSAVGFARHIFKNDGFFGFYSGFSAAAIRQIMYTGVRMGAFQAVIDHLTVDGQPPNYTIKFLAGVATGMLGAFVGLPADVAMIRMALDNRLPVEERRKYKHVFDAIARIYREEGAMTWFRGCTPTLIRAAVINTSQLLTYMQTKEALLEYTPLKDGAILHAFSSFSAALAATCCSLPFDIAKTRIQNMRTINGKPEYDGILHVWRTIIQKEGIGSLWKGFTPYLVKNGPQTMIFFIIYEKLFYFYQKTVNQ